MVKTLMALVCVICIYTIVTDADKLMCMLHNIVADHGVGANFN